MKSKRLLVFLLVIVVLLILGYLWPYFTGKTINDANNGKDVSKNEFGIVTRVVDGDTIHVNISGKDEIVRMLGINTPEKKKPYYQEAKNFLVDMVENKSVELLIDKEDVDRYERKLRYVFYEDMFVNVEIVQAGLKNLLELMVLGYGNKVMINVVVALNLLN